MKNIIFFVLFSSILTVAPTCNCKKKKEACMKNYNLQLPFSLSPQIDTFQIGDTIWLSCDISDKVLDLNSGDLITVQDFDFQSDLTIERIDVEPFINANLDFNVIEKIGTLDLIQLVGTTTFKINYLFENNHYQTKFGFIVKEKGLYTSVISSFLGDSNFISNPMSDCVEKIQNIEYLLNGEQNNNYEFIQMSADSSIRTTTKEVFDMYGQYCFYVVE